MEFPDDDLPRNFRPERRVLFNEMSPAFLKACVLTMARLLSALAMLSQAIEWASMITANALFSMGKPKV